MPSNCTYVCFPCRTSASRSSRSAPVLCQHCGEEMTNMGKQFRVPRKSDKRGWENAKRILEERETTSHLREVRRRIEMSKYR